MRLKLQLRLSHLHFYNNVIFSNNFIIFYSRSNKMSRSSKNVYFQIFLTWKWLFVNLNMFRNHSEIYRFVRKLNKICGDAKTQWDL